MSDRTSKVRVFSNGLWSETHVMIGDTELRVDKMVITSARTKGLLSVELTVDMPNLDIEFLREGLHIDVVDHRKGKTNRFRHFLRHPIDVLFGPRLKDVSQYFRGDSVEAEYVAPIIKVEEPGIKVLERDPRKVKSPKEKLER